MVGETTFMPFRHGPKSNEEIGLDSASLSEFGKNAAQEKAKELFLGIEKLQEGSVIFVSTSSTERAKQTRDLIEQELEKLVSGNNNYLITNVQNFSVRNYNESGLKKIVDNPRLKILVIGLNPTSLLSTRSESLQETDGGEKVVKVDANKYFIKCKNLFEKKDGGEGDRYDESLVGELWLSQPDELLSIKDKIRKKYPTADAESLNPKHFIETPEDVAIKQAMYFMRIAKIAKKYFGDRPIFSPSVTHSPKVDFLTMKLLGLTLNAENYRQMGGQRTFLEESKIILKEDSICVEFRGKTNCLPQSNLAKIIEELKHENEIRKNKWKQI